MGSPRTLPSSAWEEASGQQSWRARGIGPHAGLLNLLRFQPIERLPGRAESITECQCYPK